MVNRGEMSVGNRSVPVEIDNTGTLLRVTGPFSKSPVSFEGRAQIFVPDRLVNWFRLSFASHSPVRCTFTAARLEPADDGLRLKIDPGWPWDAPLVVRIARDDCGILAEWNRAAMDGLHGKDVRCDLIDDGFIVCDSISGTVRATVRWAEVKAVRAFKRDLFAYDMICRALLMPDKSWVEIWEQSHGFIPVIEKMGQVLPSIPERWYSDIMVPAFATMDTLLYRHDEEYGHWPEC